MNDLILLQVNNLSVQFLAENRHTEAVKNISFYLNKGETVGIVGESGSGKSVTALSIMQLISSAGKICGGSILFNNSNKEIKDLLQLPPNEIRKYRGSEMAMIFQEPMSSLNPVFTCGAQVAEAIRLHHKNLSVKEALQQTLALFNKVKLPTPELILNKYPHQLSGGQKQRVMIAMAMCCRPQLLIADEPTTALDVTVQATILQLMKELQQETGMGMLFISHDLGVISKIAERVLVMYNGEIVETGTVKDIFTQPQHPYTKGLLACRPPLNKRLKRLPVINDFLGEKNIEKHSTIAQGSFINSIDNQYILSAIEIEENQKKLTQSDVLLEVKNLNAWFPSKKDFFGKITAWNKAVDNVSFHIKKGESLGLVGESGCGKTTLGKTILRLIEPVSGQIMFNGHNILTMSQKEMIPFRKRMQIIFQDPYMSLNPRMTIGNAVMEPMKVHKLYDNDSVRKQKAIELLEKVNMQAAHFNRYPHEFSGGQRQRICIARALAAQPEFIVCDECVSALDVSVQAQVLNLLSNLKKEFNFSCLFISHDMSVVKYISDRIMVMNNGKIEEIAENDAIYFTPKQEYTKRLIEAIPVPDF